jgi:outer membrane protein OmpA-like peptidoglycan-associated protein
MTIPTLGVRALVVASMLTLVACAHVATSNEALQLARERYAEVNAMDPAKRSYDADRHLQRAAAAIERAGDPWLASSIDAMGNDAEHYSRMALHDIEMAELIMRQRDAETTLAQLSQQRDQILVALVDRQQAAQPDQREERLQAALAEAQQRGAQVLRTPEKIQVTFRDLTFDFNRAEVRDQFRQPLLDIADALREFPRARIVLEGHTDNRGRPTYNQALSERRADAVKTFLISQGISASRIASRGVGEAQPVATNATAEGRELNRRVELVILGGDQTNGQ